MNVEECSPLSNLTGTGTTMKLVAKMKYDQVVMSVGLSLLCSKF